jgi:hypothetical protein
MAGERHTIIIENISEETLNVIQKLERGICGIPSIVKVSIALSLSHEMMSIGKLTITNTVHYTASQPRKPFNIIHFNH